MARDADGAPCEPGSPDAVAWCAMGVIISLDRRRACEAHDYLARVTPGAVPLPIYQDAPERTLAEVTKLFDEAAVAAERDEGGGDA